MCGKIFFLYSWGEICNHGLPQGKQYFSNLYFLMRRLDCTFFAGSRQDGMQFSCFVLLSFFFVVFCAVAPALAHYGCLDSTTYRIFLMWTMLVIFSLFYFILHLPLVFKIRELAKFQALESIFVGAFYLVPFSHHFLHALNKRINPFGARAGSFDR